MSIFVNTIMNAAFKIKNFKKKNISLAIYFEFLKTGYLSYRS